VTIPLTTITKPTPPSQIKGNYAFVTLGCPKNLVDSERMLGLLELDGYRLVQNPEGADFVVVNTCGFIESARAESLATIDEMIDLKRDGRIRGVIVSGCLAERQREELLESRPEIDHLVGVFSRDQVTKVADRLVGGLDEQRNIFQPAPIVPPPDRDRMRVTPKHFAYLKISEGCDRLCTFCAIPKMRGKHVTKPIEEVLDETAELAADGVRELIVVAQDTTYYGMDRYGEPRLRELLTKMEEVEGIDWIRLMYLYPMYFSNDLIDHIAASKKIVPYLDMPLQHINDNMLRRMSRRVTRAETEQLVNRLRNTIENLTLRTTFIVGFPGETEEQFEELVDFVKATRFDRLGVFSYSYEPDTPAARLPDQIDEEVKQARVERLMQVQQEIAFELGQEQIGTQLEVLIDRSVEEQPDAWVGRTMADAPDIDSEVYVTGEGLATGKMVMCEVVGTHGYDLIAAAIGPAH